MSLDQGEVAFHSFPCGYLENEESATSCFFLLGIGILQSGYVFYFCREFGFKHRYEVERKDAHCQ